MVQTYSALSMVAEIGGYSGLFLGFSAFQLACLIRDALANRSCGCLWGNSSV